MANTAVAELEPKHLWKRFYEITQVPRPSKKEEKILRNEKNAKRKNKYE
ncbi:MAG: hypothetical protein IH950_13095 [Bacteroidetes bacterium]|nr:hypothetical protein [Bacteroidota bacterium]